ncbi:Increased rDNA silencing protein [Maudiozyma exigua]|uniref:Increased rDNA silencing protein n=1 Tax=Maudiozyma exigua TaxID=34358 RepID=A0A9P6WBW9_MAUEX|nr:Increased rDNA silencing protein [Kazachstania exigua]
MNILEVPHRYRYKSKLEQVKSKLHHHNSKKDMKSECDLILCKKVNKLKKTLRRGDIEIMSDSDHDEKENIILVNNGSKYNDGNIDIMSRNNSFTSESERYYNNLQNEETHRYKKAIKQKYKKSAQKIKKRINLSPTAQYEKKQKKKDQFNEDKPWKAHRDVNFINIDERRRYEAMWMSNRFRYLTTLYWWPPTSETINNMPHLLPQDGLILAAVVYNIWKRSNLSDNLLANIFDLVDSRMDGTLDRKSFIVGMWLVDQCLYGRKLPQVVSQEIWESVDRFAVNVAMNDKINMKAKKKIFKRQVKLIKNTKS